MKHSKQFYRSFTALFVVSSMLCGAAQAKEAADQSGATAQEANTGDIIVTAQGREQRLRDVPVSVSVVSGASLQRQDLRSLSDLTARMPSIKITPGQSSDVLTIRGVGAGQNPGLEQSVATFVDGLYRSRSRAIRAAIFDVDRVEVLKGPQITFFGANAIAGALNITTRQPSQTFGANATALYGSNNEYLLEAGVTGPISDTLSVRVAGRANGMDDFVDNASATSRGKLREYTGRISARWEPTSNFRSDLRVDGSTSRNKTAYNAELLNCPTDPVYAAAPNLACGLATALAGTGTVDGKLNRKSDITPGLVNLDFYEIGWTNTLTLGDIKLKSITGYYHQKHILNQDLIPVGGAVRPVSPGYLMVRGSDLFHQFSQELRLEAKIGDSIDLMVGGYYHDSHLFTQSDVAFNFLPFGAFIDQISAGSVAAGGPNLNPAGFNALTPVAGYARLIQDEKMKSGFAAITIRPVEKLRINGGLRYTVIDKHGNRSVVEGSDPGIGVVGSSTNPVIPAPAITQNVIIALIGGSFAQFPHPDRSDKKLMPSIGVQYDLAPSVMTYATFSTGFKAGGYGGVNTVEEFGPEHVKAYEIGLKGSFFDGALDLSLAAFRSDYRDLQEATIISTGVQLISLTNNAASARSEGVEMGFTLRASPMLSFNADVAYLRSKFGSYKTGPCTVSQGLAVTPTTPVGGCSQVPNDIPDIGPNGPIFHYQQDLSGRTRPFSPKFSGNFGASLLLPIQSAYQLRIDPNVYFTTKYNQQGGNDPLFVQKGFAKLDLRVGFGREDQRWEVAVLAKNLTGVQTASFRAPITQSPGSVLAFPDRDRSVAVQLNFKL